MVQFINSYDERDDRGTFTNLVTTPGSGALRLRNWGGRSPRPCSGPCHGLSANAAWSQHCANCPLKETSNG